MRAEAEAVVKAGAPERQADRGPHRRHALSRPGPRDHRRACRPARSTHASRAKLMKLYEDGYAATFGRTIPGLGVEIMNWTLRLAAEQPRGAKAPPQPADMPSKARGRAAPVYDPADQDMKNVPVYHRADLTIGSFVPGPAVIAEDETTTIVAQELRRADQPDRRHPVGEGVAMSFNDPALAHPPAADVGPPDRGRRGAGAGADPHRLLDLDARGRRPVGRRVRPRGRHAGAGGDRHARPHQLDGPRRAPLPRRSFRPTP